MEIRFTGVHCDPTCELTPQTLFWNVFVFIDKSAIIFRIFYRNTSQFKSPAEGDQEENAACAMERFNEI